ncbi:helix-turn-helix domain-containing protein [Paractinoplanes durhamensis]
MLRDDYLTNEMLRQWGVDRVAAGQVLRDLVDQGLAVKEGGRRYAQYVLDPAASGQSRAPDLFSALSPQSPPGVAEALKARGEATASELVEITGLSRNAVLNHLRGLAKAETIEVVGPTQSPKRRYRWIAPDA